LVFIQNSTGCLECIVKSSSSSLQNSNIAFEWYKEAAEVDLSEIEAYYSLDSKKILKFENLSEVNNGTYVCVATLLNEQKITSTEFIVNVVPSNMNILKLKLETYKIFEIRRYCLYN